MIGHCLEVISSLDPRCGGVSASLPDLAKAVVSNGHYRVTILVVHRPQDDAAVRRVNGVPVTGIPVPRIEWMVPGTASRRIRDQVAAADLVHIHGLWEPQLAVAARWARGLRKPYVVSVHGMLERWALRNRWWKKRPYSMLIERPSLRRAACARAVTRREVGDYRRYGFEGPVAVVPYGVEIPARIDSARFFERFPGLTGRRLVLFLGRIHRKKGVDILCRAWAGVRARFPDWHLVLAGPDYEASRTAVERLVSELGISHSVTFTGMLDGELKWGALGAAEVFVLPSHSEGLPVAVLEAMGVGKPVIVTRQCNLPEVSEARYGIVTEPDAGRLQECIHELLSATPAERQHMGERGREMVQSRYAWMAVGSQLRSLYEWISGGSPPGTVEVF